MEIMCPPNSWSKTHSTVMESNSIPEPQVNIHEVNAKKPTSSEKGKRVTLQICPLRSLKSQTDTDITGHIKPHVNATLSQNTETV